MVHKLLHLPKNYKKGIIALTDSLLLIFALFISFSLRLGEIFLPEGDLALLFLLSPFIGMPIINLFGLYSGIVRTFGVNTLKLILLATFLYSILWGVLALIVTSNGIPRSVILINWFLVLFALVGIRFLARSVFNLSQPSKKNVLIFGANSNGRDLFNILSNSSEYRVVGFIDDSSKLVNRNIDSVKIYPTLDIENLVKKFNPQEILIAQDSPRSSLSKTINLFADFPVKVRVLPMISEIASGKIGLTNLREIDSRDLLERDTIYPNQKLLESEIKDKVVLVTGAGGSIGSELCRQVKNLNPRKLILFEHNEHALYNINKELNDKSVYPILGTILDKSRISEAVEFYGVDTFYHAAAYKHVPMVEFNISEGIKNNIFGTLNCAQVAIDHGVKSFVFISTDKAVRPTNIMGATKRIAEIILQSLAENSEKTKFSMVRFGNVINSSGSVIPLFQEQLNNGGPLTVTHKEITRYFMTIPEAVELVIQAGVIAKSGEICVLDMGKPVNIYDLARKIIHLNGLSIRDKNNPAGDIEIKITGLRPGEKLFEELLIGNNTVLSEHPMILRAKESFISWEKINHYLKDLNTYLQKNDYDKLRKKLIKILPEYNPQCEITDLLYRK